ncbi:hypothetical protein APICBIBUN_14495, partial [Acinetobacter pittii 42F]
MINIILFSIILGVLTSLVSIFLTEKITNGEFKHEVRQFQKPYDNQQAEQIS